MEEQVNNRINPWASRRKNLIMGAIIFALSLFAFVIFWKFWYMAPSCVDGIQNGDEAGIDCGGSCARVCSGDAIRPIIRWDPRLFEIIPGVWSALVYVDNPNSNLEANYLPYSFTIYGENNQVIAERKGATILPKNRTVGVFEGNITLPENTRPRRTVFEIGTNISWKKNDLPNPDIKITHTPILRLDTAPRVEATIRNNDIFDIKNIEFVIAIFDGSGNAIAASRTLLEELKRNDSANIFFTWPKPFDLKELQCDKPSDIMLVLDRSGSMASISMNPPQPMTDAKNAAISFVDGLGDKDKVGVVSFATDAKNPIDSLLSSNFEEVKDSIQKINIENGATQFTNIYDALRFSRQELLSDRARGGEVSKVLILLTDGVANNPRNPDGGTEEEDIKYAENLAGEEASIAKREGINIFTIGLGNQINESFLTRLASVADNYYYAPTTENLDVIYKNISSNICQEVPARVEITYRIFGSSI